MTAIPPGTYVLGPDNGTLKVFTGKAGAAAKAGHNLELGVGAWEARILLADDPAQTELHLSADARSLRVLGASGGISPLDEKDRDGIAQTIDEEVLKGTAIAFASRRVTLDGPHRWQVTGDLELSGANRPIQFALTIGEDGQLSGRAVVTQSTWGMKPYSALFGTLKVVDDVEVVIEAQLPTPPEPLPFTRQQETPTHG